MREGENLKALSQLPIDYIGFIFYNQSKRFVEQKMEGLDLVEKKKVGVFVNELLNVVMEKVGDCLLYTSPSPRDATLSRMPSSA